MKGILITQDLKDKNKLVDAVGTVLIAVTLPSKFWATEKVVGGYQYRTDLHTVDGWLDVVTPSYNSAIQKLGAHIVSGGVVTQPVLSKSVAEIQSDKITAAVSAKGAILQAEIEKQIVTTYQAADDTASLNNQAIFPFWTTGVSYSLNYKVQSFDSSNNLKLYKCVQAHTSQVGWEPKSVPALFTAVAYPGQIIEWVQPTGAQDAYALGAKVTHNGFTWQSLVSANVWEPGGAGTSSLWVKI